MSFVSLASLHFDKENRPFSHGGPPRSDSYQEYAAYGHDPLDDYDSPFYPESMHSVRAVDEFKPAGSTHTAWQEHHPQPDGAEGNTASPYYTASSLGFDPRYDRGASNPYQESELSLEGISLKSPRIDTSPPLTLSNAFIPDEPRGRRRLIDKITTPFRKDKDKSHKRTQSSPIRKRSVSPSRMLRAAHHVVGHQHNDHGWHSYPPTIPSDLSKFDFGFDNGARPLSPPHSARLSAGNENHQAMMSSAQGHGTLPWDYQFPQNGPSQVHSGYHSPLSTPPAEVTTFHQAAIQHAATNNAVYSSPHRHHTSTPLEQPNYQDFAFDDHTAYATQPEPLPLWYGTSNGVSVAQPSPSPVAFRQSTPNSKQSLAMQLQAHIANTHYAPEPTQEFSSGLMIQIPSAGSHQSTQFGISTAQGYAEPHGADALSNIGSTASHTTHPSTNQQSLNQVQPHPPIRFRKSNTQPQMAAHTHGDISSPMAHHQAPHHPSGSIRVNKASHARSRSSTASSPSPKNRSVSSTAGTAMGNSSFSVQKKRSRSFSRKRESTLTKAASASALHAAATVLSSLPTSTSGPSHSSFPPQSSVGAPAGGISLNVDFVNFTPSDSQRILTGVAPSGSSKTKARREKEAMEKSRRLSQAAVRAVQAAGGDVGRLLEEGLIVGDGMGVM